MDDKRGASAQERKDYSATGTDTPVNIIIVVNIIIAIVIVIVVNIIVDIISTSSSSFGPPPSCFMLQFLKSISSLVMLVSLKLLVQPGETEESKF